MNIGRNIQIPSTHFLYKDVNLSQEVFEIYAKEYSLDLNTFNVLQNIELRDWSHNVAMDAHTDFTGNGIPSYTLSYYLTDNYEGGNIEFPDYDISFKPSAGSVVIFPSNVRHQVSMVFNGRRLTGQDFVFEV
jgi:predicted 2-oxoglutarate/Fe(II)-dependent dioxygenase YbiX